MLQLNEPIPPFSLMNTAREPVTHEDLVGSIAVIAFFPLAFTGG